MSDPPQSTSITRIAVEEFAGQCRRHLVPVTSHLSCFQAVSLNAEQQRQFLQEPAEAVPRALLERLVPLRLLLVPYLEKGAAGSPGLVAFEKPSNQRALRRTIFDVHDEIFLLFAVEQQDVADYHYELFRAVAGLACGALRAEELSRFSALVLDELNRGTRGEVDGGGLQLKLKLQRRQHLPGRNTKLMRCYIHQALEDTFALFLHGLCCEINVDPGLQQLASRYLRKRLELLAGIFPPNPDYLLFPAPSTASADAKHSSRKHQTSH